MVMDSVIKVLAMAGNHNEGLARTGPAIDDLRASYMTYLYVKQETHDRQ